MGEWRPIPGFPGYEVSDHGRILSRRRKNPRLRASFASQKGYMEVGLIRDGRQRTYRVHRLVAEAFLGPLPEGMETRHLDGNPANNQLDNLAYGTPRENNLDQVRHGTHSRARVTHCPAGHEYTEANTYITPGTGSRDCRACTRDRLSRSA